MPASSQNLREAAFLLSTRWLQSIRWSLRKTIAQKRNDYFNFKLQVHKTQEEPMKEHIFTNPTVPLEWDFDTSMQTAAIQSVVPEKNNADFLTSKLQVERTCWKETTQCIPTTAYGPQLGAQNVYNPTCGFLETQLCEQTQDRIYRIRNQKPRNQAVEIRNTNITATAQRFGKN